MRFILDANIPYSAKKIFRKSDSALHVRDIGLANAADDDILKRAVATGAILVTRDLDFANIVVYPPETHRGVIALRLPPHFTALQIVRVLKQFLARVDRKVLPAALTIVEEGQYRVRR